MAYFTKYPGPVYLDARTGLAGGRAHDGARRPRKVFVTAENRGGVRRPAPPPETPAPPTTASWKVLVDVLKATGACANPDIGNFPDDASRAAGLRVMYPRSSGSSHAHCAPERCSEAAAIQISKEVGYKGLYWVEASRNNGPDP